MLVAVLSLLVAVGAVYPINLSVRCYHDYQDNSQFDIKECSNLISYEYSLVLMSMAVLVEVLMVLSFFYACRHEFCGVKRSYDSPFMVQCGPALRHEAVTPITDVNY